VEFKNEVVTVSDTIDNCMQLDIKDILQLIPLLTNIVKENFTHLQQLKAKIALDVGSIARNSSIPAVDRLDKIVMLVNE